MKWCKLAKAPKPSIVLNIMFFDSLPAQRFTLPLLSHICTRMPKLQVLHRVSNVESSCSQVGVPVCIDIAPYLLNTPCVSASRDVLRSPGVASDHRLIKPTLTDERQRSRSAYDQTDRHKVGDEIRLRWRHDNRCCLPQPSSILMVEENFKFSKLHEATRLAGDI
jgi:hypothetical protein